MEKNDSRDMTKTIKIERNQNLAIYGDSIIGTRDYQQDAYFIVETDSGSLAVICDGMGGMEHGEMASKKAVERLARDFSLWRREEKITDFLLKEAVLLDQLVANLQDEDTNAIEAGTTIVAVVVIDNELHWLSVGDSRIYIAREEEFVCVTRPHNYGYRLDKQLEKGQITQEEYEAEKKQAEALISYLGIDGLELIDYNREPFKLVSGDRVLLCSDGLYKCMSDEDLKKYILSNNLAPYAIVNQLLENVEEAPKRNKDNTTVILLEYE